MPSLNSASIEDFVALTKDVGYLVFFLCVCVRDDYSDDRDDRQRV